MQPRLRRAILGTVLFFVLLIIVTTLLQFHDQKGQATINFNTPDQQQLTVLLNKKPLTLTGLHSTYNLRKGNYNLSVSKPGYNTIATSFTIRHNQTSVLSLNLQRTAVVPLSNWQQVYGSPYPGSTIVAVTYFYQDVWAIATVGAVQDNSDTALVVMHYVDAVHAWVIAAGPGTSFDATTLQSVPPQVLSYMQTAGDINIGGSE